MSNSAVIPEFKGAAVASTEEFLREVVRQRIPSWTELAEPHPIIYHIARSEEHEGDAVTAYCLELPGAVTEADTADEACSQLRAIIDALVAEYRSAGDSVPWIAREPEEGFTVTSAIAIDG